MHIVHVFVVYYNAAYKLCWKSLCLIAMLETMLLVIHQLLIKICISHLNAFMYTNFNPLFTDNATVAIYCVTALPIISWWYWAGESLLEIFITCFIKLTDSLSFHLGICMCILHYYVAIYKIYWQLMTVWSLYSSPFLNHVHTSFCILW